MAGQSEEIHDHSRNSSPFSVAAIESSETGNRLTNGILVHLCVFVCVRRRTS